MPTAGKQLQKMCLILRASQHAIAPVWRKIMKQLCLGVVVAIAAFVALPLLSGSALA
jgi:hypothetical protein